MTEIQTDDLASPKTVGLGRTPRGALQSDTILNPADLAGMAAKGYIPAGTVLRKSMFQPMSNSGVPAKLKTMSGKVAIALAADINTTVGGVLKPNNQVTIKASDKGQTEALVNAATILSVPNQGTSDKAVIFAVTPSEAQAIWDAKSAGKTIWYQLLGDGNSAASSQQVKTDSQKTQPESQGKDNKISGQQPKPVTAANASGEGDNQ